MAASRSRPSPELEAGVAARLAAWLAPGARVCVACSGGRDSSVLLHLVADLAPRLGLAVEAVHVDHGLSPNAGHWADFAVRQCAALGVGSRVERVVVAPQPGEGIEAAARRARYAVFAGLTADAVLLAHHAGDQAETMLFRLLRGSAVAGAAGMPARRTLARADAGSIMLLRPLLEVAPEALAAYVVARGIDHIDDESNADRAYSRNFLRHAIVAPLDARFPGATERLARSAGHLREAAELLDELAATDFVACHGERGLRLQALGGLSPARQRNLLHRWLRDRGLAVPSSAWLDELRRQLLGGRGDARTRVGIGRHEIRAWRGEAILRAVQALPAGGGVDLAPGNCDWAGGRIEVAATAGTGLAVARLAGAPLRLAPRCGGERIRLDPRRPRRCLKQLLQERAVPPWERELVPCLWCGDELAWVGGIGSAAGFIASPGEPGWRLDWRPPG